MAKEKRLSQVEQAAQIALGEGRLFGSQDDPAKDKWPNLWGWLTKAYVGGNYLKQPATVNVSASATGFVVRLTDRDLACSCTVAVTHLEQAFDSLEAQLSNGNVGWQHWGKKEPQLRKRKN